MLDMKFSGTVDFGAKVRKFDSFSVREFVVFVQCHACLCLGHGCAVTPWLRNRRQIINPS